jgi:hypothetical protein
LQPNPQIANPQDTHEMLLILCRTDEQALQDLERYVAALASESADQLNKRELDIMKKGNKPARCTVLDGAGFGKHSQINIP